MNVDLVSITLKACSYLAVLQAAGTALFLLLFGQTLVASAEVIRRLGLACALLGVASLLARTLVMLAAALAPAFTLIQADLAQSMGAPDVVAVARKLMPPDGRLAAISDSMELTFPAARRIGGVWVNRHNSMWRYNTAKWILDNRNPDAAETARLNAVIATDRADLAEDISRGAPDVVMIESREGIRNADAIAGYSLELADAIGDALQIGAFPLVLGGDCSILLGSMIALKRRGPTKLFFVDGHSDFFVPEQSGTGGAAGMDLALVAGFGPELLSDIEGLKPYVALGDIAMLADRAVGAKPSPRIPTAARSGMNYRSLAQLRRDGAAATARSSLDAISASGAGGFWIHYDVDALNSEIMPAVDSPQADGLSFAEAEELIGAAIEHPHALGLQVTIFDPDLDPTGRLARDLSAHLQRILARRAK